MHLTSFRSVPTPASPDSSPNDEAVAPTTASIVLIGYLVFLPMILVGRQDLFQFPGQLMLFFAVYLVDNLAIAFTNHFPQLQILQNQVWGVPALGLEWEALQHRTRPDPGLAISRACHAA